MTRKIGRTEINKENIIKWFEEGKFRFIYLIMLDDPDTSNLVMDSIGLENHNMIIEKCRKETK